MHQHRSVTIAVLALAAFSSCNREEAAIRARAEKLVQGRASEAEVQSEFGAAGHVFTRDEANRCLQMVLAEDRSVRSDLERLAQHPRTLYFSPGELRQLYIFLDETDHVSGYYLTSQ
jgi:hypothetical protein